MRTGFVSGDEKESSVHDGCTGQHGGHENVVTGTIDKGDVSVFILMIGDSVAVSGFDGILLVNRKRDSSEMETAAGTCAHLCNSIVPPHPALSH